MARMVEIITTDVSEQPAVRAWRSLEFAPTDGFVPAVPQRLEMLRRRSKSIVYRLVGVGRGGGDVIAKLACRSSANVERDVYLVLQQLPIVSTEFYGLVEAIRGRAGVEACGLVAESRLSSPAPRGQAGGPDQRVSSPQFDATADDENGEFSWLFLGDAEGTPFDPTDAGQREIATRWLAALHTSSSALADASRLPARGPAHYLGHLHGTRAVIQRIRGNPIFSVADHTTLDEIQAWLDHAESRWPDIVACCREVPWALVHGDFAARNVRVRGSDESARLLAFDWEVAGWGMPAVDLRDMDLELYHALVAPHWPQLRIETLRQAARAGDLLRGCLAAVHWEALKCEGKGAHATMDNMRIFERRFSTVFLDLGWPQCGMPGVSPMNAAAHGHPVICDLDHLLQAADPAGVPELRAVLADILRPTTSARFVEDRMIWRSRVHRARFIIDDVERSLILKRLPLDRAHREQQVLRRWLPRLGLGAHGSPLLGVAAASGGECIWHVYEDLGPQALDAQKPEAAKILAAVRLLAQLHVRSATCGFLGECREFGVNLGVGFLRTGIADSARALSEIRSRSTDLDTSQQTLVDRLLDRLRVLGDEEPDRTRILLEHGGPEVLLHGDLWTCNIFTMPSAANLPVRFIDWDHAGVGFASYDLSALLLRFPLRERSWILAAYAEQVTRAGWTLPAPTALNALFAHAETARLVSAVLWPALAFLDQREGWPAARLVEVESWFDQLEPVLAIGG